MASFAKPENALKRAKELIAVSQKTQALQVLHDVLTSKKHRQWQPSLEKIMKKYIKLCVEMRKGKLAKDGLHQYRMICQQAHQTSLETIIRYFLTTANKFAQEAQSKAEQVTAQQLQLIEDLETEDDGGIDLTSSSALAGSSAEDTKERTDREIVTPWLKFLWETYRNILEILRNNQKLEALYQDVAQQAFNFCRKYKRNTEFRRLAEILHIHLYQTKQPSQQQPIATQSPESLQLHLESRFLQLDVATELELWQEAYKTIEDIHNLMNLAKKLPKPQIMANYYHKLTQIFWVSNNYLFHAYAWYKCYSLAKAQNKLTNPDELRLMTSQVLLAALSIPVPPRKSHENYFEFDQQKEKNSQLASLLGFSINPKRDVLLTELMAKHVTVYPELKDLYTLIEKKFHPLELCNAVKPKLDFIAAHPQLKQYLQPLEKLVFVRLLQQLSKVYQTMKIAEIRKLAFFVDSQLHERWLVEAIKHQHIEARIDHQNGAVTFGSQVMESEKMRSQLTELSKNLQVAVDLIHPQRKAEKLAAKKGVFVQLQKGEEEQHKRILARKQNIEKRKELLEALEKIKQKEEEERREELHQKQIAAAAAVPAPVVRDEAAAASGATAPSPAAGKITAAINNEKLEKLRRQRQMMEKKMRKVARDMDYLERARRREEKPLLEAQYEKSKAEEAKKHEELTRTEQEAHNKAWQADLEEKKRLARMAAPRVAFEAAINQRRADEFARAKAEQDAKLSGIRAKIEELKEKRRKAEEKRRAADEERARKQKEDEEAAERTRHETEEKEKRRVEEERAREEKRRAEEPRGAPAAAGGAYRPPAGRGPAGPDPRGPRDDGPRGWREEPRRDEPRRDDGPRGYRDEPRGGLPPRDDGPRGWRDEPRGGPAHRDDGPRGGGASGGSGYRDEPRGGGYRDEPRGGYRDEPRGGYDGPRGGGGGGGGYRDEPRGGPPPRDDGPRGWREDPRGGPPPRDDGPRGGWRDEPRGGPPARGGAYEPPMRRGGDDAPRGGGGGAYQPPSRRGGDEGPRGGPPPRDDGPRGAPRDEPRGPPRDEPRRAAPPARDEPADDGFQVVKKGSKPATRPGGKV